jgi:hypothetical protein
MEGTCFLKPKAADVQKMKALAPVEADVYHDEVSTTIVDDSDDEHELSEVLAPVPAVPVPSPAVPVAVEPAVPVAVDQGEDTIEEVKPKKKIVRKKTDA